LDLIVYIHFEAGTGTGLTATDLAAYELFAKADIDGKWQGHTIEIDGVDYDINIDVRFLGDDLFDSILGAAIPASRVTDVTLWNNITEAPDGNADTTNWAKFLDAGNTIVANLLPAHEFGHFPGNTDEYIPIVALVDQDLTSLMGSIEGSANVYPRHFFWAEAYLDGLGITGVVAFLPTVEFEGPSFGDREDTEQIGEPGIIYISVPEPSAWALLALGAAVLSLRPRRRAV
jgi:hypothetical protein